MRVKAPGFDLWTDYNRKISFEELLKVFYLNNIKKVFIGTDSKPFREFINYATAVCFFIDHKCYYFYVKNRLSNGFTDQGSTGFLINRLQNETNFSVLVANKITDKYPAVQVCIHSDINSNPKFKSNLYNLSAKSIITGHGYEYVCKPDAWAASTVADWYTK